MNDNATGVLYSSTDGESDLWRFLSIFYRYKWMFIGVMLISLVATFFYLKRAPRIYQGKASFFLVPQESDGATLSPYARLLGGGKSVDLAGIVKGVSGSTRMHRMVVKKVQYLFPDLSQEELLRELALKDNVRLMDDRDGIYAITFEYTQPKVIPVVLNAYINNLTQLNIELEFSPNGKILKVIDAPEVGKRPIRPQVAQAYMISVLFSMVSVCMLALGIEFVKIQLKRSNDR